MEINSLIESIFMRTKKNIMKRILTLTLLLFMASFTLKAQSLCKGSNFAFQDGEQLTYKVYYNLSFMYVGAGQATFTTSSVKHKGKDAWHVVGKGRTFSSYDWIFKVRDQYESYIDQETMQPLTFIRDVHEGGYKKYNKVDFQQNKKRAISKNGTFEIPSCIQDVISAIYRARNIDFDRYEKGDKIPMKLFLDDEVYDIYIRYMGKEDVDTRYGKFHAIKFKPLLIKGTIFEGGEKMDVWVSDDKNRIPLRVNSPISVGSIKVDLVDYENLRNPFSSLIKKR